MTSGRWRVCLEHGEDYQEAVQGCELLATNHSWVCPVARERVSGLLPRYGIDSAIDTSETLIQVSCRIKFQQKNNNQVNI